MGGECLPSLSLNGQRHLLQYARSKFLLLATESSSLFSPFPFSLLASDRLGADYPLIWGGFSIDQALLPYVYQFVGILIDRRNWVKLY